MQQLRAAGGARQPAARPVAQRCARSGLWRQAARASAPPGARGRTVVAAASAGPDGGPPAPQPQDQAQPASAVAAAPAAAAVAAAAPAQPWKWIESPDAVVAYGALAAVLAAGSLPALHSSPLTDLPYFIGLAVATIYIGAHRAATAGMRQQIGLREGLLAPLALSASLFGLFLLIRYTDFDLQTFLSAYFVLLSTVALGGAAAPLLRRLGDALGQPAWEFAVPEGLLLDESTGDPVTTATLRPSEAVAWGGAAAVAAWGALHQGAGGFTLNNAVACLVATELLQLLGIRSFRAAALLLGGLLCYDVFWVFASPGVVGENVMLAVATSDAVTGPTRLLFPRVPGGAMGEAPDFPFSLLGLGDVAIPGLLAALALRYDASRSTDMRARAAAAADAIQSALSGLDPSASGREMADAAATAALAAYDRVADAEDRQRGISQGAKPSPAGGDSSGSGDSSGGADGEGAGGAEPPRVHVSDALLLQRPTFTAAMGAYVFGLAAAFAANSITNLGQPALLYIVPSMLGAVFLSGAARGELKRLWMFTDGPSWRPKAPAPAPASGK